MIVGEFTWRGSRVQVEESRTGIAGHTVWLNEPGVRGLAVINNGDWRMTLQAPKDAMAEIELQDAYRQFREARESGASV